MQEEVQNSLGNKKVEKKVMKSLKKDKLKSVESIQTEKVTQETYSSLVKIEHKNHDLEKSSKLTAPYKD